MAKPVQAKRITDDEIEEIVAACLDRVPYKETAAKFGCSKNTVMAHWHKWLDQTTEERREQMERKRSEVIARLDSTASRARRGAVDARVGYYMVLDRVQSAEPDEYDDIRDRLRRRPGTRHGFWRRNVRR